ncbi:MAG: type II toxin-antitoxin system HicB family antitoxin [Candidatus Poribacteria bacterium]|nr:type II toxin-antitoxin system HicB family antitoxin [Candidatus Poribacteria bacterium]
MLQPYTALIRQSEGWWIGWILEVRGVTCQERTRDELLDTLGITLCEILEYETPEEYRRTESEAEKVKFFDILEFGTQGASHCTENGFEEVKIAI